jgi:hypothetical protein
MPSREERIGQWRRELAESLGGTAEALEELECHLRDEIARLVQAGGTADAAFAAAAARLGSPAVLAGEFSRGASATPWLPIRLALVIFIAGAGWLVGLLMPRLSEDLGTLLAAHVIAITLGYTATLVVGALAACYTVARPFGVPRPEQIQGLTRTTFYFTLAAFAFTAIGIVLGGFWSRESMGRFWGWDIKETAAALVLIWDALMLVILSRRFVSAHATLLLGLIGEALVALAWFGPGLLGAGAHSHGHAPAAWLLGMFLCALVGLAGLGLIPPAYLRRSKAHRTR